MPIEVPVPPTDPDTGMLRPYTEEELAEIDIKRRGVRHDDHIEENFAPTGSGGPRKFSCRWEHRHAAMVHFLGYAKPYVDSGVTKISRLTPETHPSLSRFNWIASQCKATPFRFTGEIEEAEYGESMPVFSRADLLVTYEMVPFQLLDDIELEGEGTFAEMLRYVIEPGHVPFGEITSESNYIAMPNGILNYTNNAGVGKPAGVPIQHGVGFTETITMKRATWERVPEDLWGAGKPLTTMVKGDGTILNRGYIGALNKTTIWGHPPLTLQLRNVEEKLLPDGTGLTHSWRITYIFAEKNTPHGHLGFYFFDNTDSDFNGYYQVLARGNTAVKTADELAADDRLSLFHVRELKNLFVPGGA